VTTSISKTKQNAPLKRTYIYSGNYVNSFEEMSTAHIVLTTLVGNKVLYKSKSSLLKPITLMAKRIFNQSYFGLFFKNILAIDKLLVQDHRLKGTEMTRSSRGY
jgi:hypothetical protein